MLLFKQNFAKRLVNADRTALFLVENRTKELYARVFDMGEPFDENNPKPPPAQKEIRFAAKQTMLSCESPIMLHQISSQNILLLGPNLRLLIAHAKTYGEIEIKSTR